MSKAITNEQKDDDRQSPRIYLNDKATLDAGPGRRFDVKILNVSAHGMMIETEARLTPGRPVAVEHLPMGRAAAKVAWLRDGHAGLVFAKPLTLEQLSVFF